MTFALKVLFGMFVMGVLDVPMIKYVISPTLSRAAPQLVAKRPDGIAALIFYVGYVAIVVFLTQKYASSLKETVFLGGLLGAFAYGTYEFTNKAVIAGWPWTMVIVDFFWGIVLTSAVASGVYLLFSR